MLDLNKNMIKEIKKDVIKFFKFIHKKINLYKFSSIYFYYIYFIFYISNINKFKVNRFKVINLYNANNLKYLLKFFSSLIPQIGFFKRKNNIAVFIVIIVAFQSECY